MNLYVMTRSHSVPAPDRAGPREIAAYRHLYPQPARRAFPPPSDDCVNCRHDNKVNTVPTIMPVTSMMPMLLRAPRPDPWRARAESGQPQLQPSSLESGAVAAAL